MAASLAHHNAEPMPLPQYGFGSEVNFVNLLRDNHFLFRVYTPRGLSPFYDDSDPFFLAPKFNERYTLSPQEISDLHRFDNLPHVGSYEDVVKHMDWTTRSKSGYISTSFSFIWSIWEALRRYHQGMKKDVEIAVIDASALSNRAVTAAQLLRDSNPSERRSEHWKWYRFAQESQSVLVHEYIPGTAILASIPLVALLEKLPSYFRRPEVPDPNKSNPLGTIGWDYTQKKPSYRHFCRDMSNRFLQLTLEAQLEDTTAGSVRLALAFLRPWFHKHVIEDFQTATVTLCALSFSIAQWPGQWWTKDHSEMWNLIRAMVLSLAEEVRESQKVHDSAEVSRLQDVVTELEETVKKYENELTSRSTKKPAHLLAPLIIPPPMRPTIIPTSPSPFTLVPSSGLSNSRRRAVLTPITPPTSPIRFTAPACPIVDPNPCAASPPAVLDPSQIPLPLDNNMEPSEDDSQPSSTESTVVELPMSTSSRTLSLPCDPPSPIDVPFVNMPFPSEPESSCGGDLPPPPPPPLPRYRSPSFSKSHTHDILIPVHLPSILQNEPVPDPKMQRPTVRRKPPTIAETASCLVTGFLVGAFIALCVMSPQRRALLTHLT